MKEWSVNELSMNGMWLGCERGVVGLCKGSMDVHCVEIGQQFEADNEVDIDVDIEIGFNHNSTRFLFIRQI